MSVAAKVVRLEEVSDDQRSVTSEDLGTLVDAHGSASTRRMDTDLSRRNTKSASSKFKLSIDMSGINVVKGLNKIVASTFI